MRTLSEHVLDIVQNAIKAKATLIEIIVEEDKINNLCSLIIKDNGCGMDKKTVDHAVDPFFTSRTTRKVGLGLPLLKQNAEASGGSFKLESEQGKGTIVTASFELSHLDKPPLGDIWESYYLTLLSYANGELVYKHVTDKGSFRISSEELTLIGQIFKTLTDTDSANRTIRRPAHLSEIEAITGQSPYKIMEVIDRFRSGGRSFLIISEDNKTKDPLIDISHEALIRKWERLKKWGDSETEAGNIYRRIADAAQRYKAKKGSLGC